SIAPLPPPATSCSAPSANPPSGRRSSMALMPNGKTARRCLAPPSRHRMRSRSDSTTAMGTGVFMPCYNLLWYLYVPYLFSSGPRSQSIGGCQLDALAVSASASLVSSKMRSPSIHRGSEYTHANELHQGHPRATGISVNPIPHQTDET